MPAVLDSYKKIQEKFGLPHLQALQNAFQFEIDDEVDLHDIQHEISGKLFDFSERVIEPLLWSSHHRHMIERDMIDITDLGKLFALYKKIQSLQWRNNMLLVKPSPDGTAQSIADMWSFWNELEPLASKICDKFSKGWTNLKYKETVTEYQG